MTSHPDSPNGPRGLGHWSARAGLLLLALAVLALPFYAATKYYLYQKYLTPQVEAAPAHITASQDTAWAQSTRGLPASTAPVVLTFHDIGYTNSPYVVTPQQFDADLSALQSAGYRTLTADEFVDYLGGGPAPPRSVLITFDDGPHGLWVYGDRILARHHMHGTVFLITGRVNRDRPYYLSWNEIARMAASGRWDFEDHTHDLHHRAPVDASGHTASVLANRIWLPTRHRLETMAEYQARVNSDIRQSIKDLTSHGLPAPKLFAYPFSEATSRSNLAPSPTLQDILEKYFTATMTDVSSRPLTASRRAAAAHQVERLEVLKSTTPQHLLASLTRWTQVPPDAPAPLTQPALWNRNDGTRQSGLGTFTGTGPYPTHGNYAAADYRAMSSLDWNDYQVNATITGLGDGTNQAAVAVRNASLDPVSVSISQGFVSLSHNGTRVAVKRLAPAPTHTLRITVTGAEVVARVDGVTTVSWTSKQSPGDLTGGIGIRVGIHRQGLSWPRFTALGVSQLSPSAQNAPGRTASGYQQTVAESQLLDPNARWLSAPDVTAPFHLSRTSVEPTGDTLSAYGAYQPDHTADWTDYRISGTITRLHAPGVSGAIWVRTGSPLAISVQVSRGTLQVLSGDADGQQLVGSRPLTPADSHQVTVTVTADSTVISVDGTVRMTLQANGETGGVAYSAYRDLTRHSWPILFQPTLTPMAAPAATHLTTQLTTQLTARG